MLRRALWVSVLLSAGCAVKPPPEPCANVDCGEGRCVVDQAAATCVCDDARWVDGTCVTPSPCEVVSCDALNGSSCVVVAGLARCECPGGALAHEGSCIAPNPCLPSPCTVVRRTTCEVVNGGASCVCDRGYAPEGDGCAAVPLWSCNTRHAGPGEDSAEPDECPLLASTLERNVSVARNLMPAGDHDWLQLSPWLNEVTQLTVTADDVTLGLLVELYDAAGTTLLATDNHGARVATVAYTSRTGEPVMARVRSLGGGVGGYTAKYESLGVDDHADRAEDAVHLQLPSTIRGTALHPRDLDVMWLEFPAMREVSLRFESTGSRLELRRDGVTVRTLRNGDTSLATIAQGESVLAVVIPETGLSDFALTVTLGDVDDHSDDVAFATRINADNAWQAGETGWSSDIDSFVISQRAGYRYSARWQSLSGSTLPGISVFEANGAFVGSSGNAATSYAWFAVSAGDAYVRVRNPGSGVNASRFQLAIDDLGADDHSNDFIDATPLAFTQPGIGILSWSGDSDFFSFDAIAGHVVQLSVAQVSGELAPGVVLFNSSFEAIAVAPNTLQAVIASTGKHFVQVGPVSEGIARYSLTLTDLGVDDHGNTEATATPMVVDAQLSGRTQYPTDADVFSANVTSGVVYRLEYSHQTQSRDVTIRQGTLVLADVPLPADGLFSPTISGTVFITVRSAVAGDFQVRLVADRLDDVGNVPANAALLTPSSVKNAALEFGRDVDVFRIPAEARRVYTITASSPSLQQLRVTQLNQDGTVVRTSTGSSTSLARDTAGDLFVSVASQSRQAGAYTVVATPVATDDHATDTANAMLMTVGTPLDGNGDFPDDVDTLQFDAPAQRHLRASCTTTSGGCTVTVFDGAGWSATSSFGSQSTVTFRVEAATRLFVSVKSELTGATWSLSLTDLGPDDVGNTTASAQSLPVDGVLRTFALEVGEDIDVFKLTLNAGDIVWLTLNRHDVRVRTATGALVVGTRFRAAVAGDYFVEVFSDARVAAPYELTVQLRSDDHGNTLSAASPLASGVLMNARSDYPTDLDFFAINATAGQQVDAEVTEGCRLRIISATNSQLAVGYEPISYLPTTTGPLYVAVGPCDEANYALAVSY